MAHPKRKRKPFAPKGDARKTQKNYQKRGRLIVRNLPFKTTEETLHEHFKRFGEIIDLKLLRRPDGKLVGCGFVEFKVVQNATKAMYHLNAKPFMGRPIICDWAVSKDRYVEIMKPKDGKRNDTAAEDVVIKDETVEVVDDNDVSCKSENEDDVDVKSEEEPDDVKEEEEEEEDEADSEDEEEEDDASDDDDDDDDEDDDDVAVENDEKDFEKKFLKIEDDEASQSKRYASNDVNEGKTVFIKNVPFSATKDDLRTLMMQFGPIYYALICMDPLTEHSKGTAFVKFMYQQDAEKCLAAGTELKLQENILDCHKALDKNELNNKNSKSKEDKNKAKDSRNLYLIKEGVILAGTKAAEGVSASDMAKRLQLEQHKTQMLKNLNMFISRVRLIIHNLPTNWDDNKVRTLFKKYTGPKTVIREAKVMRDLRNVDGKGVGTSKEFGFVSFESHEDALKAARALNNNPNIFSKTKRPIVSFSIENRVMINAKQKRLMVSRVRNPNSKEFDPFLPKKTNRTADAENVEDAGGGGDFSGTSARPGVNKMRTKYSLKVQAKLHHEQLKNEKKKQKSGKKSLAEKRQDFIRLPSQKMNKKAKKDAEDDNFSKLVNSYKTKLMSVSKTKKAKWYE